MKGPAIAAAAVSDSKTNQSYTKIPSKPKEKLDIKVNEVLWKLDNGENVDFSDLDDTLAFIEGRYDCSDFRLQSLLRILYRHRDKLDEKTCEKIKSTLLGFRYWMDEPGEDSMCFWSENHQILFASAEYLAGQLYPMEIFTNGGITGREHMEKARRRILDWLELRWKYGFTEWYSNVYYVEDLAAMSNLVDFCRDGEMVEKTKIIMDLLLYDIASQSYKGNFVTTSGRLYERQKKSGRNASTREITRHIWGYREDEGGKMPVGLDYIFITVGRYRIPEVIREIGRDEGPVETKASNGLDLRELKDEGLYGLEDRQIMMQLGMGAFTNPQVISNTMKIIKRYRLYRNEFLDACKIVDHALLQKILNYTILKKLGQFGLLPFISRLLKPQTNGVAIQRANTYAYKTSKYTMGTAQSYHPGEYGHQQHIWTATLGSELSIFTTHPAVMPGDAAPIGNSPTYWVGSGRLPHSVQQRNVNLTIYVLPDKKGIMERKLLHFTHAYFPKAVFDEVRIESNYAFGRYRDVYVAFTAKNELHYAEGSTDDLVQEGKETFWICEIGTADEERDFERFIGRIESNTCVYDKKVLTYVSNGRTYRLEYGRDFYVDGKKVDTDYPRINSPYARVERGAKTMKFEYKGKRLYLDFDNGVRKEGNTQRQEVHIPEPGNERRIR